MSWAKVYLSSGVDQYVNLDRCVHLKVDSAAGDWFINAGYTDGGSVTYQRLDGTFTTQADAETVAARLVASEGGSINAGDLL